MMKQFLAAAFVLALCACAPTPQQAAPQTDTAQSACTAQGGSLERVGRAQTLQCVVPYADAGEVCRSGSECDAGVCQGVLATPDQVEVTGRCQASNMAFGCYTRVNNGRAEAAICVD